MFQKHNLISKVSDHPSNVSQKREYVFPISNHDAINDFLAYPQQLQRDNSNLKLFLRNWH